MAVLDDTVLTLAAAFEALAAEAWPACLLDERLRIAGVNGAWNAFALANGGEGCLGPALHGTAYLRHVEGVEPRTRVSLELARAMEGDRVSSDSECNTPDRVRLLRTNYVPVRATGAGAVCGVLVVHTTVVEFAAGATQPHGEPSEAAHRGGTGQVIMCSCCRRVRRALPPRTWEYVPAYLAEPPSQVSHGFCPTCAVQYGLTALEMKLVLAS